MTEYPVMFFSTPMIRALLAGRKTQMRKLRWQDRETTTPGCFYPTIWQRVRAGDRLWVKEPFVPRYFADDAPAYRADWTESASDVATAPRWLSAVLMPRSASRLTLGVTEVRFERLQDISEEDAEAEGMQEPSLRDLGGTLAQAAWSERQMFARLWEVVNGLGAWKRNPEVVALSFTVARKMA